LAIAQWDYGVASNSSSPSSSASTPASASLAAREVVATVTDIVTETTFVTYATRTSYVGWHSAVSHSSSSVHDQVESSSRVISTNPAVSTSSHAATSPSAHLGSETSTASASAAASEATSGGIAYHQVFRQTQLAFSEVLDQSEYGYWYYLTANIANLTHRSGEDTVVRSQFASSGTLDNTADTNYRAINDSYPVFAYALNLGSVGTASVSSLFTISLNQKEAIQVIQQHYICFCLADVITVRGSKWQRNNPITMD